MTSPRVVLSHSRLETDALKQKLDHMVDLLIKFGEARPDNYDSETINQNAKRFWDDLVEDRKKMLVRQSLSSNIVSKGILGNILNSRKDELKKHSKIDIEDFMKRK